MGKRRGHEDGGPTVQPEQLDDGAALVDQGLVAVQDTLRCRRRARRVKEQGDVVGARLLHFRVFDCPVWPAGPWAADPVRPERRRPRGQRTLGACHQHRRASPRRSIVKHPPDHGYVVVPAEAVRHHNYRRRRLVHDESELGLPVNGDDRVDDGTQTDHSLEEHNCLPPIRKLGENHIALGHTERSELRSQPIHLCPEIPVGKLHRPVRVARNATSSE